MLDLWLVELFWETKRSDLVGLDVSLGMVFKVSKARQLSLSLSLLLVDQIQGLSYYSGAMPTAILPTLKVLDSPIETVNKAWNKCFVL